MKRTPAFDFEIMGSVSSWPVNVALSRNRQSGLWTIYFNYVDPEARAFEKHCAETPSEFRSIAEERYMNIDAFCQTGLTQKAIRRKIEEGKWLDGREYRRASDGGIYISIKGYTSWLEQGSMHGQDQSGSRSHLMASRNGTR